MKNIISFSVLLIIFAMLFTCSCEKAEIQNNNEEVCNFEVTAEPFEEMEKIYAYTDVYGFESEAELFDSADLVFIGMPTDTFTECQTEYYDLNEENKVSKDDKYFASYTIRNIKVIEVFKGDSTLDSIRLAERGTVTQSTDGQTVISGLASQCKIAKKNVKYLYYANYDEKHGFYMAHLDAGKINIDGLDTDSDEKIDDEILNEVKVRFSNAFQKYDRSSELSK